MQYIRKTEKTTDKQNVLFLQISVNENSTAKQIETILTKSGKGSKSHNRNY